MITEAQIEKLKKIRDAIDDINRDDDEEFIEDLGEEMVSALAQVSGLIDLVLGPELMDIPHTVAAGESIQAPGVEGDLPEGTVIDGDNHKDDGTPGLDS